MTEQRRTPERRSPRRDGRRKDDPLINLATDPRVYVTLAVAAEYFGLSPKFMLKQIGANTLKETIKLQGEWRLKVTALRAFETASRWRGEEAS